MRKKIMIIISETEYYGIGKAWRIIISGLEARGYELTLVFTGSKENPYKDIMTENISCYLIGSVASNVDKKTDTKIKLITYVRSVFDQLKIVHKVKQIATKNSIDSILVRRPTVLLVAGLVAKKLKIKSVWLMPNTINNNYIFNLNKKIYKLVTRIFDITVVANSEYTGHSLDKNFKNKNVVYLGVDVDIYNTRFQGEVTREQLDIPRDAILIGILARLTFNKGQHVMIDTVGNLSKSFPRLHLLLCGGPTNSNYAVEIKKRSEDLGIQSRVHFTGFVSNISQYINICNLVVNPSQIAEGFGISVVESMAMGKPVLAYRLGGPGETIVDGKTGWLVDSPNSDSFEKGIVRAMRDRNKWENMGKEAEKRVIENYTNSIMISKLDSFL